MDELLPRAKTSAGLVSLRFMLRTRLFFGFYPHLSSRVPLRLAARFYCITVSSTLITILLRLIFNGHSAAVYFILPALSDYVLSVLVSLITEETDFFNYCKVIEQVDIKLDVPHLPLLTRPAKYIFIFFSSYHVLEDLCSSLLGTREIFSIFSPAYFISVAVILHGAIHINFLDLLRSRLSILRQVFELNLETRYGNLTDNKIESINNCMQIYKSLIENLDATFFWPKVQIIARFISCFAVFISQGAFVVWIIKYKDTIRGTLDEVSTVLSCGIVFFVACLPAIFGELINKEVDELKTIIGNQLIDSDDSLRDALMLAADYLQQRPFSVKVFGVFSLDASLVFTFAGLCTTYLIVVLQITGVI